MQSTMMANEVPLLHIALLNCCPLLLPTSPPPLALFLPEGESWQGANWLLWQQQGTLPLPQVSLATGSLALQ